MDTHLLWRARLATDFAVMEVWEGFGRDLDVMYSPLSIILILGRTIVIHTLRVKLVMFSCTGTRLNLSVATTRRH